MNFNIIKNQKKLYMLVKMELKRIMGQLSNLVLLGIVLVIFINMFIFVFNNKSLKFDAKVALAIEDKSFEVGTLIGNITNNKLKNIIKFEDTSLDEGLKLLRENKVIAIINVKKGTTDTLNRCDKSSFDLYINDESNILVKFLVEYIDSLVEVLNEGQRGAMIYWNIMKTNGYDYKERLGELNNIAMSYISNFLSRSSVFEESEDLDKYNGSVIDYYYISAILIIAILLINLYHADIDDDFKANRITRLSFSDIKWHDIYIAKAIVGTIYSTIIILPFMIIRMKFLGLFSYSNLLQTLAFIMLGNIIINLIVISMKLAFKKSNIISVVLWVVISITSGIIIPLTSMNKMFRVLSRINILSISHTVLMSLNVSKYDIVVCIAYILTTIVILRKAYYKRMCKYD
ncbi:ABC transporter permease [Clostridiaceae bacterium M8S5]|nr:ABC transporter permease [Clostridiaceae bacterium M8S5]